MRSTLALIPIAALLLAGCSGSTEPPAATSESPTSVASSAPPATSATPTPSPTPSQASTPTPSAPQLNERGNLPKQIGETAGLLAPDGNPMVTFVVTAIEPNFQCTTDFAEPPKNGNYIAITIDAQANTTLTPNTFFLTPDVWKVISPDGVRENDSLGNSWSCLDASEQLPDILAPSERAVGKVVLDSANASGFLVMTQGGSSGGWEWAY